MKRSDYEMWLRRNELPDNSLNYFICRTGWTYYRVGETFHIPLSSLFRWKKQAEIDISASGRALFRVLNKMDAIADEGGVPRSDSLF